MTAEVKPSWSRGKELSSASREFEVKFIGR